MERYPPLLPGVWSGLDEYTLPNPTRTFFLLPEPDPNYFSKFPSSRPEVKKPSFPIIEACLEVHASCLEV